MTTAAALRARYAKDGSSTASPNRLLLMLLDRLVLDGEVAVRALEERDHATAGTRLKNAQAIAMQLRSSLDLTLWPQGQGTADLYVWLYVELVNANVEGSAAKVRGCLPIMRELRATWYEAARLASESA